MTRHLRHLRLLVLPILLGVFTLVSQHGSQVAEAQSTGPKIAAISVNAWTSSTATITFSLSNVSSNQQVDAQIQYGTSSSYSSTYPATFQLVQANDSLTVTGLTPATTYHYRLLVKNHGDVTPSDQSADRTFSTKAGDNTTTPTITIQNVDCIDTYCVVTFTTATTANATIGWDTVFRSPTGPDDFCTSGVGYANCQSEVTGSFLSTSRTLRMSGLTAKTTYHYRLEATGSNTNYKMTGSAGADMQITTSANSSDHTFSTGNCTEGANTYPIGACLPSGRVCTADGPVQNCTSSCGYSCPTNPPNPTTCRQDGSCQNDPSISLGNPNQCNAVICYNDNGTFKNPAPAGCYSSFSKCSANTILKVQPDRGCNLWLTCATSVQTQAQKNQPAENLCLDLAACNQIGANGQCTHFLPQGQCDNDPLRFCSNDTDCTAGGTCNAPNPADPTRNLRDVTYTTPNSIKSIAQLSGNVVAGLDWSNISGSSVLNGLLPWQLMRQIGGSTVIKNGDMESDPPNTSPWLAVPEGQTPHDSLQSDFEDPNNSVNHVLKVTPVISASQYICVDPTHASNPNNGKTCDPTDPSVCASAGSGTCAAQDVAVNFSGAASDSFSTVPSEYYYAEARVRAPSGTPTLRFEMGFNNFTEFTTSGDANGTGTPMATSVDFAADATWQHITIGPIKGLSGTTRVAVVCADNLNCSEFWIDDVQVKPVLQTSTTPSFVTPSCRLYPKDDSPACDYTDSSGVTYKGWHGYCLEHDSQTGNCLSWWPVDLIKGESSVFGTEATAGYQDRSPLYYCAQAAGDNVSPWMQTGSPEPYGIFVNHNFGSAFGAGHYTGSVLTSSGPVDVSSNCNPAGNSCGGRSFNSTYSIAACSTAGSNCQVAASTSGDDGKLIESQIGKVNWVLMSGFPNETFTNIEIDNTPDFQASSQAHPWRTGCNTENCNFTTRTYRYIDYFPNTTTPQFIRWIFESICGPGGGNCVTATLRFDAPTGRFLNYALDVNDQTGNNVEMIGYQVVFKPKELCQAVVQTVKPDGTNVAFADRITSNAYTIDGLGLKRGSDFSPFGSLVPPADKNVADPATWPALTVESPSQEYDLPGQARSGVAYACNGDCSTAICHVADPSFTTDSRNPEGNVCTLPATSANSCAVDSDSNGKADGICSGGVVAASDLGRQAFSPAQTGIVSGGICPGNTPISCDATRTITGVQGFGLNAAKAAGKGQCGVLVACDGRGGAACAAQGITGSVVNYNTFTVDSCSNFLGLYTCRGVCSTTSNYIETNPSKVPSAVNANQYYAENRLQRLFAQSYGIWSNVRCVNYAGGGVGHYTTTACVNDGDCAGYGYTTPHCQFQTSQYALVANSIPDLNNPGFALKPNAATPAKPLIGWIPPTQVCPLTTIVTPGQCTKQQLVCNATSGEVTGVSANTIVDARTNLLTACNRLVACDGTSPACTAQGVAGTKVNYNDDSNVVCAATTSGSTTTWACSGECTATSLSYVNAVAGASTVPPVTKSVRPAIPNDYCAIPPTVSNIKFTNATSAVSIIDGGSGSVGLSFNSNADSQQQPLNSISIDWGDSQKSFPFQFAPKSSPASPHVYSHVYGYNNADATHCTKNGPCVYHIKIQVKDNWGWCTDANLKWCTNNATKLCSADGDCGGAAGSCASKKNANGTPVKCQSTQLANGDIDSTYWVDSGLMVVLNP